MLDSLPVSQMHVVTIARPAAVCGIRPRREDRAEHAMLHVEHRHVLVDDDLQPLRRTSSHEIEQLVTIEIVRRGDSLRAVLDHELSGQFVRHVQRKVGDERHTFIREEPQAAEIADQDSVRSMLQQRSEQTGLLRLLDARCCQPDCCTCFVCDRDGFAVLADVLKIDGDLSLTMRQHDSQLIERAAEDVQ